MQRRAHLSSSTFISSFFYCPQLVFGRDCDSKIYIVLNAAHCLFHTEKLVRVCRLHFQHQFGAGSMIRRRQCRRTHKLANLNLLCARRTICTRVPHSSRRQYTIFAYNMISVANKKKEKKNRDDPKPVRLSGVWQSTNERKKKRRNNQPVDLQCSTYIFISFYNIREAGEHNVRLAVSPYTVRRDCFVLLFFFCSLPFEHTNKKCGQKKKKKK